MQNQSFHLQIAPDAIPDSTHRKRLRDHYSALANALAIPCYLIRRCWELRGPATYSRVDAPRATSLGDATSVVPVAHGA
jgi:hypothetical protein